MVKKAPPRRRCRRRVRHRRRAFDGYTTILQRVGLAFAAAGVFYGQAEMLGEPWRHYLAVGALVALICLALWMKVT